jgi:hypothetical protein
MPVRQRQTGLHLAKPTVVGDKSDYDDIRDGLPRSDGY